MSQKVSIKFYPHPRAKEDGTHRIMGRIVVDRRKAEFSTDLSSRLKDWDQKTGEFKKHYQGNEELTKIKSRIYSLRTFLELEEKEVTARKLKELHQEKDKLRYTLAEYYRKYIDYQADLGQQTPVTITKYEGTLKYLNGFLQRKGSRNLKLNEVDYKFISEWNDYLSTTESKQFGKPLSYPTIHKHHVRLKTVLLKAFNEGHIRRNPYAQFKLTTPSKMPKYLTKDELERITEHDLGDNHSLKKVRDIFLFSCYTGLRFQDAQNLTMDDVHSDKSGKRFLEITQGKTGEEVFIPLFDEAEEIVDKWEELDERQIAKKVLPQISNVKVNSYLKVIQELCEIKTKLTHNVARHTFATTVLLDRGVPLEVTSKLLGHTTVSTTQIYGKITKNNINEVLNAIKQ